MTNVQTITVSAAGNVGATSAFDVTSVTGLTQLTVTSNGTNADNLKASATTNVNDTVYNTGATVTGGLADTVTAAGAITVTNAAGAIIATDNNVTPANNAMNISGGTTVVASTTGTRKPSPSVPPSRRPR